MQKKIYGKKFLIFLIALIEMTKIFFGLSLKIRVDQDH